MLSLKDDILKEWKLYLTMALMVRTWPSTTHLWMRKQASPCQQWKAQKNKCACVIRGYQIKVNYFLRVYHAQPLNLFDDNFSFSKELFNRLYRFLFLLHSFYAFHWTHIFFIDLSYASDASFIITIIIIVTIVVIVANSLSLAAVNTLACNNGKRFWFRMKRQHIYSSLYFLFFCFFPRLSFHELSEPNFIHFSCCGQ